MKKRDLIIRKVAVWRALKQENLIEKLPPCAVDILLNYDEGLSFKEYFHSAEFLAEVKAELKEYSCYEDHGIAVDALRDMTSISLLPYFAYGLVGRLKQELNVAYFSDDEIHSLLWERITRKIHTFDPQKGAGWEAYLQMSAFRDVKKIVIKEIKLHEKFNGFEAWQEKGCSNDDGVLLPSDAQEILKGVRHALQTVLADEVERRLFEEAMYSGKTFEEIAVAIGSNKATISLLLGGIREKLTDALEKRFRDFGKRSDFQRFEVFAEIFRECFSREEFRQIF